MYVADARYSCFPAFGWTTRRVQWTKGGLRDEAASVFLRSRCSRRAGDGRLWASDLDRGSAVDKGGVTISGGTCLDHDRTIMATAGRLAPHVGLAGSPSSGGVGGGGTWRSGVG